MRHKNVGRIKIHGRRCVYCGETAETEEHFPPASYSGRGWLLPACAECNFIAGIEHQTNFAKRATYVQEQIAARHIEEKIDFDVTDMLAADDAEFEDCVSKLENNRKVTRRLMWDAMVYLDVMGYREIVEKERGDVSALNTGTAECPACHKIFETELAGLANSYCTLKCKHNAERRKRLGRPVDDPDKVKKEERVCLHCNKNFSIAPSSVRKYCNDSCREEAAVKRTKLKAKK